MSKGGITSSRNVMGYKPPQGPTNINSPNSPGLHGKVYSRGTQGQVAVKGSQSGSPGLHGENMGKDGTQK